MFDFLSNVQGVQLPDAASQYGKMLTLQQLSRQNRMGEEQERDKLLARKVDTLAAQGFAKAQQTGDWKSAILEVAQQGDVGALAAQKMLAARKADEGAQLEMDKKRADIDKTRAETGNVGFQRKVKGLGDIANVASGMARSGRVDPGMLQSMASFYDIPLPARPEGMPDAEYAAHIAASAVSEKDRLGEETARRGQDMTQATAFRGQDITSETARRGQDISAQTAREGHAITARGQDLSNARGLEANHIARDRETRESGKEKALTETQGNATAFGMRMRDATKTIAELESKGAVDPGGLLVMNAGNTGYTGPLRNAVAGALNPQAQVYKQAMRNWVTANLRKESGAAIPEPELEQEFQKWFPAYGDSPEVVRAKAEARKIAEQAMTIQAGPGAKNIPDAMATRSAGGRIAQSDTLPDPASLPDGAVVTDTKTGNKMVVRNGKYMLR